MLRTNLSTRPFYNVTIVRAVLAGCAAVVLAISLFNVVQVMSLRAQEQTLSARATAALAEADRLVADAKRIRAQVDPRELEAVSAAAREANDVIEQKAFSWSQLLAHLEATLPNDVRLKSIQPRVDDGVITVTMGVEAKSDGDLAAFIFALEEEGTFKDVRPTDEQRGEDDVIDAHVEGIYVPPARVASVEPLAKTTGEEARR